MFSIPDPCWVYFIHVFRAGKMLLPFRPARHWRLVVWWYAGEKGKTYSCGDGETNNTRKSSHFHFSPNTYACTTKRQWKVICARVCIFVLCWSVYGHGGMVKGRSKVLKRNRNQTSWETLIFAWYSWRWQMIKLADSEGFWKHSRNGLRGSIAGEKGIDPILCPSHSFALRQFKGLPEKKYSLGQ